MKRIYSTYNIDEFILIGRADALTDSKKQSSQIIDELNLLFNLEATTLRLKNYLLGYRLGTLEKLLRESGEYVRFDLNSKAFIRPEEVRVDFNLGYNSFEINAEKEAKRELKIGVI